MSDQKSKSVKSDIPAVKLNLIQKEDKEKFYTWNIKILLTELPMHYFYKSRLWPSLNACMSPVSPVFNTVESVRLPVNSKQILQIKIQSFVSRGCSVLDKQVQCYQRKDKTWMAKPFFFLWVHHLRLSQRGDETVVGWLNRFIV